MGEKRSEVTLISGLKCRELMSPGNRDSPYSEGCTHLSTPPHRGRSTVQGLRCCFAGAGGLHRQALSVDIPVG